MRGKRGERKVIAALGLELEPGEMQVEGANATGKPGLTPAPPGH